MPFAIEAVWALVTSSPYSPECAAKRAHQARLHPYVLDSTDDGLGEKSVHTTPHTSGALVITRPTGSVPPQRHSLRWRRWGALVACTALGIGLSATSASADSAIFLDPSGEEGTIPAIDVVRYRVSLDASTIVSTVYFSSWDRATLVNALSRTYLHVSASDGNFMLEKVGGSESAVLVQVIDETGNTLPVPGCPVTVTFAPAEKSVAMSTSAACLGTPSAVSAYHYVELGDSFDYADSNPFGPSWNVSAGPQSGLGLPIVTVQRFWSQAYNNAHFFTADGDEAINIYTTDANWTYEKVAFSAYATQGQACATAGLTSIYRFYSPKFESHFFTSSAAEMNSVRANDRNWNYEGVAYCAPTDTAAGTAPLFRFWSARFGKHFYTADSAEAHQLRTADPNWAYEGVAYNVLN
ncbi:hypothetical protein [Pengzhenrongella sicca]|uniref:DUF5648 domain-containing protein n=1 Tax=Pengzhenrongella sicca TaxID=2819238 RepID=A0A8A4ZGW3_9MICO|nr:hypothetical protein [Pengzhenrongella sicca]QTE30229.1 hypothetical protein J4E96_04270 [Pengzhenrongella sicca]